jgi:hypothetical protein
MDIQPPAALPKPVPLDPYFHETKLFEQIKAGLVVI